MQGIQHCVTGVLQEKNGKELIIIQEIFPEIRENLTMALKRSAVYLGNLTQNNLLQDILLEFKGQR